MRCLYCTSEALPFIASGGLGDVSGSLPKALRQRLIGCRVVMPLYKDISYELKSSMRFVTSFNVPVAWRNQYCGVFEAKAGGIIYYFIDNEYYFKRNGLYGYYDDAERFAFFSRAILEMLVHIDFKPDILHANDWQTALVPVYYSLIYANNYWYRGIKTVFTIHNIQYQGKYGKEILEDVVGIDKNSESILEFDDCINFMKGAIEASNIVTTVSPTYANEILDPWYSHGLDPILKARHWKLEGILNGIDYNNYNPEEDTNIYCRYSSENLDEKVNNKLLLQERLFLEKNPDIPLISVITRLVPHKGISLIVEQLERIINELGVQFVILGSGEQAYEDYFRYMQEKYKGKVSSCFGFVPELSHKIYAASDIFLMPSKSEPCGLSQMIALRYGAIPVVRETGGLRDSVVDSQDGYGNGFTFKNYDSMDMFNCVRRAVEGYKNKDGWNILVKRAMNGDNSWSNSANEYIRLYKKLLK